MLKDFFALLFPEFCVSCKSTLYSNEKVLCSTCIHGLPKVSASSPSIEARLAGRVKFQNVYAFLKYTKGGMVQQLLFSIKYKGKKEVAGVLGKWFAYELLELHETFDVLIPVPLHKKKLKQRGYNQSELLADAMAQVLGLPVETGALYRKENKGSLTKKSRVERWKELEGSYCIKDIKPLEDKHVLIVDDVITSGATFEAVGNLIGQASGVRVSFAALAIAM